MYRHGRSLLSLVASKSGVRSSLAERTLSECHRNEANFIHQSLARCYGGELAAPRSDLSLSASQLPRSFLNSPGCSGYSKSSALSPRSIAKGMNAPYSLNFGNFIHSASRKDFEAGSYSKSMNFVRGALEEDEKDSYGVSQLPQYNDADQNSDIVHISIGRNNTFVTVTDSKGNKKCGASSGCLPGGRGGGRYSADAAAEHVGRLCRTMGLKSVVMKVNGFTFFKRKRQAILSWRDGFNQSRVGDNNAIVCVEDTTRRAHNGCRLPKRRRV